MYWCISLYSDDEAIQPEVSSIEGDVVRAVTETKDVKSFRRLKKRTMKIVRQQDITNICLLPILMAIRCKVNRDHRLKSNVGQSSDIIPEIRAPLRTSAFRRANIKFFSLNKIIVTEYKLSFLST